MCGCLLLIRAGTACFRYRVENDSQTKTPGMLAILTHLGQIDHDLDNLDPNLLL